jgi:hypothetical protein
VQKLREQRYQSVAREMRSDLRAAIDLAESGTPRLGSVPDNLPSVKWRDRARR